MFRIVVLEDNPRDAERMQAMLERYAREHDGLECAVRHYDKPLPMLEEYRCDADLMFLDIQTPGMSGVEAAKRIRAMDDRVMLVFTTSLAQYAIEGYSVRAFDYILKPLAYDVFSVKLDRVFRMLERQNSSASIEIGSKYDIHRIRVEDIVYIEVANHDVLVHTAGEVYRQWGSLREIEAKLQGENFVRCNSCYLVNLRHVKRIHEDRVLVGRDELAISRPRRKDFLTAVAQYKGGSR